MVNHMPMRILIADDHAVFRSVIDGIVNEIGDQDSEGIRVAIDGAMTGFRQADVDVFL